VLDRFNAEDSEEPRSTTEKAKALRAKRIKHFSAALRGPSPTSALESRTDDMAPAYPANPRICELLMREIVRAFAVITVARLMYGR
jgi:hypothetical protein